MLIEVHMLKNYAPSNLNRDDSGSPKSCVFGCVPRGRISSQTLKRNLRKSPVLDDYLKEVMNGIRTRKLPQIVGEKLLSQGVSQEYVDAAMQKITGFGNREGKENKDLSTSQVMFFSPEDISAVAGIIQEEIKSAGSVNNFKNIKAKDLQAKLKDSCRPLTLDISLFGRMITSEAFRNVEAAVDMAHAISTNRLERDFDYFTAVDDIPGEDETGAGMVGDVEFNSNCYYHYFAIDVDQLRTNLTDVDGAEELISKSIPLLVRTFAYVAPSGKQNSFATYPTPSVMCVEIKKDKIPVSYTNAFIEPARNRGKLSLIEESTEKLVREINRIDQKFDLEITKRLWFDAYNQEAPQNSIVCSNIRDLQNEIRGALGEES